MKKLIYILLLLPFLSIGQTTNGTETKQNAFRSMNPQTVTNASAVTTMGTDGTMGKSSVYDLETEERIAVNDVSYIISGTKNKLIAYTAITADRTVTLPLANTANQRIWITDESGLCSNSRRIIVQSNGSDVIGGDSFSVINFPNGSGYLESNGAGKWNIISTTSVQFSSGVNTLPSYTDNGNGSVTLGTGVYSLYANTTGVGRPKAYQIAGGTFTLTDNSTNYIYAQYNTTTGAVSLQQSTTDAVINDLTTIPIYSIYRQGLTLHARDFDTQGVALANKLNRSIQQTQKVRVVEGGVLLGETTSPAVRTVTVSAGTAWVGATEISLPAVNSASNTCYRIYPVAGVYQTTTTVTQYDNQQYSDGTNLQTLTTNNYGVRFIYRSIGNDNDMAIVVGEGNNSLGQAQVSVPPANLPAFLRHMTLVGRIIVKKGDDFATQIDQNTGGTSFSSAGVTDHNALNNLQTAQTGVTYGHITDGAQTISGVKTFSPTVNATTGTASGIILTPTLTATANNDLLVGLEINPSFNSGAFTGVKNYALMSSGDIIPKINNITNLGALANNFLNTYTNNVLSNAQLVFNTTSNNSILFQNAGVEKMRLFSGGNLLIQDGGTFTNSGYRLDVTGLTRLNGDTTIGGNTNVTGAITASSVITSNFRFSVSGSITSSLNTNDGASIQVLNRTINNSSATIGQTIPFYSNNSMLTPIFSANNTGVTYTNSANLYIAGAPTAGANVTITNPWALYVNNGNSFFAGNVLIGTSTSNGNAFRLSGTAELITTPTTSAGTYDILTRNTSTGVVEKVASTSYATTASPAFTGTPTAPTATSGTNTTQIATTAFVQTATGNYKKYVVLLDQSGTSAPTETVLENTIPGTIVWSRIAAGQYRATLSAAFPIAKTVCFITGGTSVGTMRAYTLSSGDEVEVIKRDEATSTNTDTMQRVSLEIRVYP